MHARLLSIGLLLAAGASAAVPEDVASPAYGVDAGGSQYSPAARIDVGNVAALREVWTHHSGDLGQGFAHKGHSFEATPVLDGDTLYFETSSNLVIAVDARTGTERWRFDPRLDRDRHYSESAARGLSLWHGAAAVCPRRVFAGTLDGRLIALDAATGAPCTDFGAGGTVDLTTGVGDVDAGQYGITSPPAVAGDVVVVGSAIGDNRAAHLERGIVRALDARTGAVRWSFDPIPTDPADPAAATWAGDSASRTGAANVWAPPSVDPVLGLAFVATSSPSPDFYGGERLGDNRYANSVVALRLADGSVAWHRQLVHHDVWDYDVPMQPTLVDLPLAGGRRAAVVVATKTGMLFAFDRATGAPLHPIVERPVPASDVPGELLSPTQPYSALPMLADQHAVTVDDAFGVLYFDRRWCAARIASYRSEGLFTPPSLQGSLMNPSWAGGANWGGVSVRPDGTAVVFVNLIPGVVKLIPRAAMQAAIDSGDYDDWELSRMAGTPYGMARRILTSPLGLPCTRPPWSRMVAVDLVTGTLAWSRPLGTIADLAPAPVPNLALGVPGLGGPLQTGGGLVFIGAAAENVLRALDARTGAELWQAPLPAAPIATPMTYVLDGVQYLVIAAGGHPGLTDTRGDALVAFRLPPSP